MSFLILERFFIIEIFLIGTSFVFDKYLHNKLRTNHCNLYAVNYEIFLLFLHHAFCLCLQIGGGGGKRRRGDGEKFSGEGVGRRKRNA